MWFVWYGPVVSGRSEDMLISKLYILSFYPLYSLYGRQKDKRSGWVSICWVWIWWFRKYNGQVVGGSADSGCHKLSEIYRLCGLKGHAVEIRWYVTLELRTDNGWRDGMWRQSQKSETEFTSHHLNRLDDDDDCYRLLLFGLRSQRSASHTLLQNEMIEKEIQTFLSSQNDFIWKIVWWYKCLPCEKQHHHRCM